MKVFIAYKFSGEDKDKLKDILTELSLAVEDAGHETFVHFRDVENWKETDLSSEEIIRGAFLEIDCCDAVLALVLGPEKSEGMCLELGYAKALGKKIILATKEKAGGKFLRDIADVVLEFEEMENLKDKIKTNL